MTVQRSPDFPSPSSTTSAELTVRAGAKRARPLILRRPALLDTQNQKIRNKAKINLTILNTTTYKPTKAIGRRSREGRHSGYAGSRRSRPVISSDGSIPSTARMVGAMSRREPLVRKGPL